MTTVDRWFVGRLSNGCVKVYDIKNEYDSIIVGANLPDPFNVAYAIASRMNDNPVCGRYVPQEPTSKE